MTLILADVPEQHLERAQDYLRLECNTIAEPVLIINRYAIANLAELREYYEGPYRQLPGVQHQVAAGRIPIPADTLSESQWLNFATTVHHVEPAGGLFPLPSHSYRAFTQPAPA